MSKGLPQTSHTAILGKKGVGKDVLAQDIIHDLLQDGYQQVWSNITMFEPHNSHAWNELHTKECEQLHMLSQLHKIRYLRMLRRAKNAIVYISELSKAIPSRRVGRQTTEIYNLIQDTMNRLRKKNCPFIYSDQWRRGADIMIRTNVDYVRMPIGASHMVDPSLHLEFGIFKPQGTEFWEMERPQSEITYMPSQRTVGELFGLFKTEEVVPLTYNPPFNVDSWTRHFITWCEKHNYILAGMKDSTVRNVISLYEVKKTLFINNTERSAVLGALKVSGKI